DGAGEVREEDAVAVAEDHLPAVPERVVVRLAVVDVAVEAHALVVDGVALEDRLPEIVGIAEAVVGVVDRLVLGLGRALAALHDRIVGALRVAAVEDGAALRPHDAREEALLQEQALGAQMGGAEQRAQGRLADAGVTALQQVPKEVRRDDALATATSGKHGGLRIPIFLLPITNATTLAGDCCA